LHMSRQILFEFIQAQQAHRLIFRTKRKTSPVFPRLSERGPIETRKEKADLMVGVRGL